MASMSIEEVIVKLFDVKGLLFGNFTVRTGESSPVYINMRVIWSYPDLVRAVSDHIWELTSTLNVSYDRICGLPYQGTPIATYLSTKHDVPMLLKRKDAKKYGTCKTLEGDYTSGDSVLIVDDVLMTGGTLVEDVPFFLGEKLKVPCAVVFFDREQGGKERIQKECSLETHSVVTISKAFEILEKAGRVDHETVENTMAYIRKNRFD